jgi:hypothetical protein
MSYRESNQYKIVPSLILIGRNIVMRQSPLLQSIKIPALQFPTLSGPFDTIILENQS